MYCNDFSRGFALHHHNRRWNWALLPVLAYNGEECVLWWLSLVLGTDFVYNIIADGSMDG